MKRISTNGNLFFFSVESIYIYIYTEDWNRCLNLFIVHLIPLSFS